jgi:hypothetical protein
MKLCRISGATFVGCNFLPRINKIYPREYFYPFRAQDRSDPRRMKTWNTPKNEREYAIHHWSGMEKDGWIYVND